MKINRLLMLMMACLLLAAPALANEDGFHSEPTDEVRAHILSNLPDFVWEDYIVVDGTPGGTFGFALVSKGGERRLLGYERKNGLYTYWLRSDGAAPQGAGYLRFIRHTPDGSDVYPYQDTWGFSITRQRPNNNEYADQYVSYHWLNGGFKLFHYVDREAAPIQWTVTDDSVSYQEFLQGDAQGTIPGIVQRDLRYVSFGTLPKTIGQARDALSTAPDIPQGELTAQRFKFTGGQKYPVYTGPGTHYLRAANGKAAVSTNDWIQVFGQENGWILIQYDLSSDHMRIGYIEAAALPRGANVGALALTHSPVTTNIAVSLTDDPLFSRSALAQLPQGQHVTRLAGMGAWAYIETKVNNVLARGFVPAGAVNMPSPTLAPFSEFPPQTTPGLPAGTLFNGVFPQQGYTPYVAMNMNAARTDFEVTVHALLPNNWRDPAPGVDALLGYQLYENNKPGGLSAMSVDANGYSVFLLSVPVSTEAKVLGLVPVYAVSGAHTSETITVPLP